MSFWGVGVGRITLRGSGPSGWGSLLYLALLQLFLYLFLPLAYPLLYGC